MAFAGAFVVVATHWAVRHEYLQPFAGWPRLVRRWTDPLLRPIERRLAAAGGNPQDAGLWLLGGVVLAGLFVITLVRWIFGSADLLLAMRGAAPAAWVKLLIDAATGLVMTAILIRVVGTWLGPGRYNRWMRPAYVLSDWVIEPVSRRIRPMGPIDLAPFIAYLILFLFKSLVLGLLP